MADEDDQTTDEAVATSTVEVDEETQDESTAEDTTTDDAGEETEDEAETDSEDDSEPERRFNQFKAENDSEYIQKIEDAYAKSTTEGQRLYDELEAVKEEVLTLTAKDSPDQEGQSTETSMTDKIVMSEYRKRSREAYDKFVDIHPELKEDTVLAQRLQKKVGIAAKVAMEDEGEMLDMDEALRIGWAALGYDNSDDDTSSRQAIKEQTGVSKTTNRKKKVKKEEFSPEQMAVAKRMYPNKSNKELAELLTKHKATT